MKEPIIRDVIRFVMVGVVLAGLIYFFYPLIRYEYTQNGETQVIMRIDRITGEVSRLSGSSTSQDPGWHVVPNTKGK